MYSRHQPTQHEMAQALAAIEQDTQDKQQHMTLDDRRVCAARRRLLKQQLSAMKREKRRKRQKRQT